MPPPQKKKNPNHIAYSLNRMGNNIIVACPSKISRNKDVLITF